MGSRPKIQAPPPPPTVSGVELPSEQKQQQTQDYLKQTQQLTTNTLFAGRDQDAADATNPNNPNSKNPTATKKRGLLGLYQ
jgi:preprotein translocase subunit SecD